MSSISRRTQGIRPDDISTSKSHPACNKNIPCHEHNYPPKPIHTPTSK